MLVYLCDFMPPQVMRSGEYYVFTMSRCVSRRSIQVANMYLSTGRRVHYTHAAAEASYDRAGLNPLMGTCHYNSAISNNMKLVHWPLMGGLLRLVQRRGGWAGPIPPRPLIAVPNAMLVGLYYTFMVERQFVCVNLSHDTARLRRRYDELHLRLSSPLR